MRRLLHYLGFHWWEYSGITRKCRICGKFQVNAQVFNGDDVHCWIDTNEHEVYYPKGVIK